jgi:ectoine hydroxylase-related dioxygenase (phytanoyl-CoA dioxygenase family)
MIRTAASVDNDAVSKYRRDGYLIIRGLLDDDELREIRSAFAKLQETDDGALKFKNSLIVVRNLWLKEPVIKSLVWARIAPLAARLLGLDRVQLIDDNAFVKPPKQEDDNPTGWHQDSPNFPFDRRGFMTIWVAVDDIDLDQGPLTFLPGGHRIGPVGAFSGDDAEVSLQSILLPEDLSCIGKPVTTPLVAGDATVHDGYMLHSAGPNSTNRPRRAWAIRFVPPTTLYTGGSHRSFDNLGLVPFEPIKHVEFPVISVREANDA